MQTGFPKFRGETNISYLAKQGTLTLEKSQNRRNQRKLTRFTKLKKAKRKELTYGIDLIVSKNKPMAIELGDTS